MAAVILDSRFSAPSRRKAAARRRCAGPSCRTGAMDAGYERNLTPT
jgi:hypothetical protein